MADGDDRIERHVPGWELRRRIDRAEDTLVRRRLVFVERLYGGRSVAGAASAVGTSATVGRRWLARWNQAGSSSPFDGSNGEDDRGSGLLPGTQEKSIERRLCADGHL
jgi:transposase